ncbi:hypothetical protein AURDEDRAFT_51202 [Auricularia subglabra TFB-10046 SS5]|nr:hypothetical protein AURDEDRAFT_51202 [Auricularia subglabra TFB-10046 SS5]
MFGTRLLVRAFFLLRLTNVIQAALTAAAVADASGRSTPGVTAVLLNWARLRNNIDIVHTLCAPENEDIVRRHFARSAYSSRRLHIINSPQNVYFQARFLACAAASTEFCFIQDDDYLVLPGTIRALHTHLSASPNLTATHLLPPHEHLATTLRTAVSADNSIHTGFAWLGHGAMLRRSAAMAFLQLLGELNLSDLEMKMADNYYTILSNAYPDIWMDDGTPLDGIGAFTVGTVGDERNWDHMV